MDGEPAAAGVEAADESARSRRQLWTPPARPDWVRRVNAEGACLDMAAVVPLDEASLLSAAIERTGLSDFGDDAWREPFRVFIKALDEEADLNFMGRVMTRSDLIMFLEARLRIEDQYRRHPEIEDEVVVRPLWIVGQGRTGTSILQTLLGLDPANRSLSTWEAIFPVPPGDGRPDDRRAVADARQRQWSRVAPEIDAVHHFAADTPAETIMIEALSFCGPAWLNLLGMVPSFNKHVAPLGAGPALRYARRVLKFLQWRRPGRRWVLKSPDSMQYVPDVLDVFPDACLVWPHRDPVRALSSAVNLMGTLSWIRSDRLMPPGVFETITDPAATGANLARSIDWISAGRIPAEQLCNIHYRDLVSDPAAAIERIYAFFGLPFDADLRAAIAVHLRDQPREARPEHRYSLGDRERIARERPFFKRYQDFFKVESEV